MKVQWAQEGTVFRLRRQDGAFVYESKEGGADGAIYDRAAATAKAERVFLTLLQNYEEQGRRVSPNASASFAPAVFEREADAEGVTKRAFALAMSKLLKDNLIHIQTDGSPARRRERLAPGPKPKPADEATAND